MNTVELHRLDGSGCLPAGCLSCPLLSTCGGIERPGGAWSCMDNCARCDPGCDRVCLHRPRAFVEALHEIDTFGTRRLGPITGPAAPVGLPRYVPVLQHPKSHTEPLSLAWAAIPLHALLRGRKSARLRYSTGADLRDAWRLLPDTRVIIVGTGRDPHIERYWRWRRLNDLPTQLASLDVSAIVAPNYSVFWEDPRPQHLFNRKRSLLCAAEFAGAGLPTVPFLTGITRGDWLFWARFLSERPHLVAVAKEFQTGRAHPARGQNALERLRRLEVGLGRNLHLVAIGATRFRHELARNFRSWTLLDSTPFMKAIKRQQALGFTPRRVHWQPAHGAPVSALLQQNIDIYTRWLDVCFLQASSPSTSAPTVSKRPRRAPPPPRDEPSRQLHLPIRA